VLVLLNPGDAPAQFQPEAGSAEWRLVASSDAESGLINGGGSQVLLAPRAPTDLVPAKGVRIWVRR
jgi:hypothetical protein